ncbi:NYN domain-containing protein [Neptunomonas phycophila]|uniref:NYN domain-containing protein n=1 Tax=Neptunomonas phycophila TaxID=1572645 RepID=UPI000948B6ED|nr:NYN domain-containing protein [Neptunomonas phycophila]
MEKSKIAIFVDVENLTKWVKEEGLEKLVTDLGSTAGRIVTRKAYGVWSNSQISNLQAPLNRMGFDLIHSYHPVSGKNSADIQFTMDVLESAIRVDDIEQIVLATGDSDFSPLFRRLREMGKEVIGVGPRSPLSECVKSSCTRYIYTDVAEAQEAQYELAEAKAMVEKIIKEHGEPMSLGLLKSQIISTDNSFDERTWEYSNFSSFVRDIPTIDVYQARGKTHWLGEIKQQVPDKSSNHKLSQATTDEYKQLLRQMNWPFVPRNLIIILHKALQNTKAVEASYLKENLVQFVSDKHKRSLMQGYTASDLKKGLTVLFKAKLFNVTAHDEDKYWKYIGGANYLSEINNAMSVRVRSACGKANVPFDTKYLQPLLYPKG